MAKGKIIGDEKAIKAEVEKQNLEEEKNKAVKEASKKEQKEYEAKKKAQEESDKKGGVRSDYAALLEKCRILYTGNNVPSLERYLNEEASSMDPRDRYNILMKVING